jgi:1-acyl-sn-glycerol-3-phosphate acyltransferase
LKPAEDAIVVDTTNLGIEQVIEKLLQLVKERCAPPGAGKLETRNSKFEIPGLRRGWFWLARWMCRVFCMLFFRWRWYGIENIPRKGPFLLLSNHQSFLDPIFCGGPPKRHLCFLARDTLFAHWFFGRVIASVNAIPVKRERGDVAAMKKVIAELQEGRGVCLFPEGTRTSDGKILPFKAGLGLLCRRGNAAIVPVVIDGAFECWPRNKKIFSPGGTIIVYYGKAITPQQAKDMGDEKLAELLTSTLRQMQTKSRIAQGKKPYDY